MTTMYLVFNSLADAQAASAADWERFIGRPADPDHQTQYYWGIISNTAGTIGVIADNISRSSLSSEEQGALVDETDPTVAAVLAAQPKPPEQSYASSRDVS
jgi:hypothetical protein